MRGKNCDQPRAPVVHHSAAGMFAIRDGQWKLILGNGSGGRAKPRGQPFTRPYQLYDVGADIGETRNLIEQHPDIAQRMEQQLEKIRTSGASRW